MVNASLTPALNINDDNIKIPDLRSLLKDPVSCLTHALACVAAVFASPFLLIHAADHGVGRSGLISLAVFMLSMIMLYGASASYHAVKLTGKAGMVFKRIDHMMIFVLIAGSYTPVCICAMGATGRILLAAVWAIGIAGMLFKLFWVTCPKWLSSVIYIGMGWVVVFAMPTLIPVISKAAFGWLLAGGIIYTIGGVIYALKLVSFNSRGSLWGSHEIFHLFVMAGSLCHFISMWQLAV